MVILLDSHYDQLWIEFWTPRLETHTREVCVPACPKSQRKREKELGFTICREG